LRRIDFDVQPWRKMNQYEWVKTKTWVLADACVRESVNSGGE